MIDIDTKDAISVVIPTYRRERVLLDTIEYLLALRPAAAEILIVDQTESHEPETDARLRDWHAQQKIRWIRLSPPSITHAMNHGLQSARSEVVLFLDDDIIPHPDLLAVHLAAQAETGINIVAGQVLQPGEEVHSEPLPDGQFLFRSGHRRWISELMGGNFSVKRRTAFSLSGFDENFVRVAYRFEAEFCDRALSAGERILFEPAASIRHLKASAGGTRSYGHHLTTVRPSHAVGAYYYLLRARQIRHRFLHMLSRFARSVRTRHHLHHPWWIPGTLLAELLGFLWAVRLLAQGPKLLKPEESEFMKGAR